MKVCSFVDPVASFTSDQNKTRCCASNWFTSGEFLVACWPRSASTCLPGKVYIFRHVKSEFYLYMYLTKYVQILWFSFLTMPNVLGSIGKYVYGS